MKRLYILVGLSLLQAQSEPINRANFRIDIAATNEEIVIDGELTETVWKMLLQQKIFLE